MIRSEKLHSEFRGMKQTVSVIPFSDPLAKTDASVRELESGSVVSERKHIR